MKAIVLKEHGGPDRLVLEERRERAPGPGELLVENAAVGVNFIDIYQRTGLYPVGLPAVPGMEGAGVVIAADGATGFAPGDRIAYLAHGGGAYAARATVPAAAAAKIPDGVDEETAAAVFLKGLTAQMLARQVYRLEAGRRALVYAAAGGVGTLLCQWAAHLGAEVIAVVGAPEKADIAARAGAAHVIVRTETDSISAKVRELTAGRGVDVVYDSVGAATFEASLDSLAMRGLMVSYGNASGPVPPIAPLELARRGSLFLTRPTLFHYATPDRLPGMAEELFDLLLKGVLRPAPPTVFPLEQAGDAHRLLESGRSTGSIVLKP
ncbi:MAG: quinone oxidoreductase [Amphiplicatus sp.]